ncbi:Uma2 family endonuclease [Picosynechococcus sp. NKBG042902]|uniref:Uma2 family endonuclease n=1 Tax=Picosynechococcus sp. NKBG042902 TaxID=490193 RepID=UPI0004AB3C89|nr:Uma2 family endonuclease [Picosynechococcus sp. NKBG042902]
MIALSDHSYLTPEEYLAFEAASDIRHEYVDGEVYAMAGTSKNHNLISGNLYILLRRHLRNSGCTTFMADIKVKLQTGRRFFYPDLVVTCDPEDGTSELFVEKPKLIIEVLSPSTKSFDQTAKFLYYRTLPSLEEYLLVGTESPFVQCFRRQTQDIWTVQIYEGLGAIAHLESFDLDAPLTDIYEGVTFTAPTP